MRVSLYVRPWTSMCLERERGGERDIYIERERERERERGREREGERERQRGRGCDRDRVWVCVKGQTI